MLNWLLSPGLMDGENKRREKKALNVTGSSSFHPSTTIRPSSVNKRTFKQKEPGTSFYCPPPPKAKADALPYSRAPSLGIY